MPFLEGARLGSGWTGNTVYPYATGGPSQLYWVGVVVKRDFPVAQFILGSSSAFTMKSYAVARVVSPFPAGVIMMWSGAVSTIPAGWQLCNGTNRTPNLQDRFIVGAGNAYGIRDIGGEATVPLSEAQMPQHRHSASTNTIAINDNKNGNYGSESGRGISHPTDIRHV